MKKNFSGKKIIRITSITVLVLVLCGYGIWQSRYLLFGVKLNISNITNGQTVTDGYLPLSGTAKHAVSLTVDNRTIPISESGAWSTDLEMIPGYNVITVIALDKFGKSAKKEYVIYYKAPMTAEPPSPTTLSSGVPESTPPQAGGENSLPPTSTATTPS